MSRDHGNNTYFPSIPALNAAYTESASGVYSRWRQGSIPKGAALNRGSSRYGVGDRYAHSGCSMMSAIPARLATWFIPSHSWSDHMKNSHSCMCTKFRYNKFGIFLSQTYVFTPAATENR